MICSEMQSLSTRQALFLSVEDRRAHFPFFSITTLDSTAKTLKIHYEDAESRGFPFISDSPCFCDSVVQFSPFCSRLNPLITDVLVLF